MSLRQLNALKGLGAFVVGAIVTGCGAGSNVSTLPVSQSGSVSPTSVMPVQATSHSVVTTSAARKVLAVGNAYPAAVLSNSPLAYYQMNDTSPVLTDSGPNGVTGTYGSTVTLGSPAITTGGGTAATFPGGSTYDPNGFASTPVNTLLQPSTLTLEAWVKLNTANTTKRDLPIVGYGDLLRGIRYGLYDHGIGGGDTFSYVQHNVGQTNQLYVYGHTKLVLGVTYHLVAVFDGSTVTTYVNGVMDQRVSAPGTIDYPPANIHTGLQIGGNVADAQWGDASFGGTVAQVALYSQPLSNAQVTSHFLAGQIVPMVTENASSSDSFVDSIGLNAHFENPGSPYATQYPAVKNLLVASGIRHVRVGMTFNNGSFLSQMQDLAASGVRGSYVTQLAFTQDQITQFPSLVGSSFEQYEAPNEQDESGDPNWAATCIAYQQNLYSWVKNNPSTAAFTVLGPALSNRQAFISVGDISAFMDNANIHDYFSVFEPGTTGWGGYYPPYGYYGAINYNVNLAKVTSSNKPVQATETGYGTIAGNPLTLDYRADLRYMSRLFFQQYNNGVRRSYSYEMLDEGGDAVFANFGIVDANLHPKPAYTAIKSLIAALKDPGTPVATKSLTYNITGFNNNVAHTLLQKRDGSYVMAIWIESPAWNTVNNAGGDIIVAPQTITLSTANALNHATLSAMDENGNMTTSPVAWANQSGTFTITDKVSLLTLTP